MPSRDDPVLSVDRLKTQFDAYSGIVDRARSILQGEKKVVRAVDDVSIDIGTNEVHGVIGESGCGKTTFINTIIGLVEPTEGEIAFDGKPLDEFTKENWKAYRRRVQLIFQDPYNSLDPKMKVGGILSEPLRIHDIPYDESKLLEVLRDVELTPPRRYFDKRPSQLSGGERQRVSIARALIMQPDLILADEPVSMLDVSTQAAILKLISKLIDEREMSMIYISHDLSTVSYICDSINVMYLGRFVETGPTRRILDEPKHPYTQALINAIPHPNPDFERKRTEITGSPGDAVNLPTGCRFKDRCPERMDVCDIQPESVSVDDGKHHTVACHLYYDHMDQAGARAQDAAELEGSD